MSKDLPLYALSDKNSNLASLCQNLNITEEDLVSAQQVHGDGIAIVSQKDRGKRIPHVDALLTNAKKTPLVIRTADCAPILIFDPIKKALALIHAGRRGTEMGITYKSIKKLRERFDSKPENLIVKIGPCIDKCCYPMDLKKENLKQLIKAGLFEQKIEIHPECTCCNIHKYFSYRGDGPGTKRMFLVAMI